MSNEPSILILDSNIAFATMLQEGLKQNGEYRATVTTSADEALEELAVAEFDLAIVDLGLTDPDGPSVARALRQQQPNLRVVVIPLVGEEIPPDLTDLPVQGVLSKPFFLPELPGRIADALARPAGEGPGTPEPPVVGPDTTSDQLAIPREHLAEIVNEMALLSQEINAEAVILTCGESLIARTGRLPAEDATGLAQIVAESWRTSARVAQILGREQLRFEQSVEGGEHMFYSLAVTKDIILSAALRVSVPLGMIRLRAKSTAETVRALIGDDH